MAQPPKDRDRNAIIAALAEEARSRSTGTDGPEPEKLLDFLAGRLHPEEEERLSHYLLASPETSRALLDLEDLEAAGAEAGKRPTDLAAVAGWRDFESRLPSQAPPPSPRLWSLLLPYFAAALFVSTLGLSTWAWRLQGELSRPVANPQSLNLKTVTRASEPVLAVAPGDPLLLTFHPAVRCPDYTARIEGPAGRAHRPIERLKLNPLGNLNLLLQRVRPGAYSLRLSGCEPRQEVGNYRFRITPDGG
jgi:hypothetical protein